MKKVKQHKRWSIYQATMKEYAGWDCDLADTLVFLAYLPDESPREMCSPEFECGSIQECIDNIESY